MSTTNVTPIRNVVSSELPVVAYERQAIRLHDEAVRSFISRALSALVEIWIKPEPGEARVSRQRAMHPDKPAAVALRELGLERFLTNGAA